MPYSINLDKKNLTVENLNQVIFENYEKIISPFYEMQTSFISARYKLNKSIETSNILTLLSKNLFHEIIKQREKDLNFDISFNNYFAMNHYMRNNSNIFNYGSKIISIVDKTGIPKETVRRKLKKLIEEKTVSFNKDSKLYYYNLAQRNEEIFKNFIENDITSLARFVSVITKILGMDFKIKIIENQIKKNFSFYYYHFYNCQLEWMKMWQHKLKDVDLVFIAIQALIPTLKYIERKKSNVIYKKENLHSVIGKASSKDYKNSKNSISPSSISLLSGIPRATCSRKLDKLVNLGLLVKEIKTKGYFINQVNSERTKNIFKKENIISTVEIFSKFLALIIKPISLTKTQD